jgi:hypothetical protein
MSVTIKEIRAEKAILENKVKTLLQEFEIKHQLKIENIFVDHYEKESFVGTAEYIGSVKINVEI